MDHYVIRVGGRLSDGALSAFDGLQISPAPVETLLHGNLPDQAALAGVLGYLDELGVDIVEVLKIPRDRS